MKILVVKTCDGDCYFTNKRGSKVKASDMAAEQVLFNDLNRWHEEVRAAVQECVDNGDYGKLYKVLVEFEVITEVEVRE